MQREAFVRHWLEQEVDVATRQSKRLPRHLGHIDEITRGCSAHDPVHTRLYLAVHSRRDVSVLDHIPVRGNCEVLECVHVWLLPIDCRHFQQ